MTRKTKFLLGIGGGIALLVVLALSLGGAKDDGDAFAWDKASRGDIRETISASGEIQARVKINVGTSVMGEIKALHVQDGQDVQAGQLLVTIDQERLVQEINRASSALDASAQEAARQEATMKRARENADRVESLFRKGIVSDEDYRQARLSRESAELAAASARANQGQARAALASARDAQSKAVLRAPISGRVTGLKAEKGETAIPGQSNLPGATLMVISDMSEIIAEIKVNESEVVRTKVGQVAQVSVESLPGRIFPGRVLEVASAAERTGQDANMYRVKVALDMKSTDLDKLRPGMSARALILTAEAKGVLRVPLQAVLERDGNAEEAGAKGLLGPQARSVVLVAQNGRVKERVVRTGIANTQYYEVLDGLQEGEAVLTGPIRKVKELKDGQPARLRKQSDSQLEDQARARKGQKP